MFNALPSRLRGLRRRAGRLTDDRGQSLVELAMALPVILLLTLVALDFGRVYLGYINLQNMTRIAANFAANSPDAWGAVPETDIQTKYRNQILADAAATNCDLPSSAGAPVVPIPTFSDSNGNGEVGDLGDMATVQLSCTFGVITPFISNIVGGSVRVSAESNFPVKSGMSAVAGGGSVPVGTPPNAAFLANAVVTPNPLTVVGPSVNVDFHDTSGGNPTKWAWDFDGDGTVDSTLQDPLQHPFSCAFASCIYVTKLKTSNLSGSSETSMTITVIGNSTVNFTADKLTGPSPLSVTFTDASTAGGTAWNWTFGDGQAGTGTPVTHTYTKSGATYNVTLTVTYPSPVGPITVTKTGYISTDASICTPPSLNGVHINDAQAVWQGSPWNFTGTVIRGPGSPQGNFIITTQDKVAGQPIPCNSNVTVNRP